MMLIDNPVTLIAACSAAAAAINLAMLKLSPGISDRMRHLVSGTGPVAASLGAMIAPYNSVTANGTDLAVLGASLAGGVAAAMGATRFVRPQGKLAEG